MNVEATVDDREWAAALDELIVLCHEQGKSASLAGAEEIRDEARVLLTSLSHAAGTKTPSPRGAPPASISGDLAASMDAEMIGDEAWVGPTRLASSRNGPYGRAAELGVEWTAYMKWTEDGNTVETHHVTHYPRPFLRPATEMVIDSGKLYEIYVEHWTKAIEEVAV